LATPGVIAPIVGVTGASHLHQAVAALDIRLSEEETDRLEAYPTRLLAY
jgi:aryl-alcohol dehydrogenase-like predicted oxidoreductase